MKDVYKDALAEIDYIISFLDVDKYNKIPTKLLDIIKKEKSMNYIPYYDVGKSFDEQNFSKEVIALLAILNKYITQEKN